MSTYDKCPECGGYKYCYSMRCGRCAGQGRTVDSACFICPECGGKKARSSVRCVKCERKAISLRAGPRICMDCGKATSAPTAQRCRACYDALRRRERRGRPQIRNGDDCQLEYRIVVGEVLGRPLENNEFVHHINMDATDNRKCNLLVCNWGYHQWLHAQYRQKNVDLTALV